MATEEQRERIEAAWNGSVPGACWREFERGAEPADVIASKWIERGPMTAQQEVSE